MKIIIHQKPDAHYDYTNWEDCELDYYKLDAVLKSSEDTNAIEVCKMFYKAMLIEGYHPQSIAQAMYDVADYVAYQINYQLKNELDGEDEQYEED